MSADKNVFSACVCADPWCREHGCRLATQQRYGPQTNYAPVLTALPLPSADAVAEERAAVVAYLLRGTADCRDCMDEAVVRLAREIERGEHRRGVEP